MIINNLYLKNEKQSDANRLTFLLILTFFTTLIALQISSDMQEELWTVSLYLLATLVFSLFHYIFLEKYPHLLIGIRQDILIILDIFMLTLIISTLSEYGLYLFPLYIIIVMRSGSVFGMSYFYLSIIVAIIAWISLLLYSPYWTKHYNIIAIFAITTLVVPLFYFKLILEIETKNEMMQEYLANTNYELTHDLLTGLFNRYQYKEVLKSKSEQNDSFSLLFININHFQDITHLYGYEVGNYVLIEIAKRLNSCMGEEDFLAKINIEEFAVITTRNKLFLPQFLQQLEQALFSELLVKKHMIPIELNIGISHYPEDTTSPLMLAKYADIALNHVSNEKNKFYCFYNKIKH